MKKIYSPLLEGLLALYLGIEWVQVKPRIGLVLFSFQLVELYQGSTLTLWQRTNITEYFTIEKSIFLSIIIRKSKPVNKLIRLVNLTYTLCETERK